MSLSAGADRGFEVSRGDRAAHCRPTALDNPGSAVACWENRVAGCTATVHYGSLRLRLLAKPVLEPNQGVLAKPNFESLNRAVFGASARGGMTGGPISGTDE
jgi:hypothetical protein